MRQGETKTALGIGDTGGFEGMWGGIGSLPEDRRTWKASICQPSLPLAGQELELMDCKMSGRGLLNVRQRIGFQWHVVCERPVIKLNEID